jgi:hypothetical protein
MTSAECLEFDAKPIQGTGGLRGLVWVLWGPSLGAVGA